MSEQQTKKQTIVFVEDEPTLQKALGQFLENAGYQIHSATDGESGLALIEKIKPDLILLDLVLPKKDGFTILQSIKANEQLKNIPVIVLTNLEESVDIEKALRLGASTYLVKANYQLPDVAKKIKDTLNNKQ